MRLAIQVNYAYNLPNTNSGPPNPLCAIKIIGISSSLKKTRVIEKSCNPQWETIFEWILTDYNLKTLHIEILNSTGAAEHQISFLDLPIKNIPPNKIITQTFLLQPFPAYRKGGQIQLKIHFASENIKPFSDPQQLPEENEEIKYEPIGADRDLPVLSFLKPDAPQMGPRALKTIPV